MRYKAVQLEVKTGEPTGRLEHYVARGKKEAAKRLLYTRRIKNGRCRLGPTGLVVSCVDGTAWVIIKEKRSRRSAKR